MARDFDGTDDQIDVGNWNVTGQAITFGGWFFPESFNNGKRIISKALTQTDSDIIFMLSEVNPTPNIRARIKVNAITTTVIGTTTLIANQWHHGVGRYDGSNVSVWLDGVNETETARTGDLETASHDIFIGRNPGSDTDEWDGRLAEIFVANRAYTDNEILAVARGLPPIRLGNPSLVGYWPLGLGSPEPDLSGQGRNGTVTGAVIADHAPIALPFGFDEGYFGNASAVAPVGSSASRIIMSQQYQGAF